MDETLNQAYAAIQRIFPCEKGIQVPLDNLKKTLIPPEIEPRENPFLIRIAGQSGSGKSTQILPFIQQGLTSVPYIPVAVRFFAPFHPAYETLKKTPALVREKTNGFALIALFEFYRFCITHHFNVLLDMTLLEPEIDVYMMRLAKENGYKIHLHVLSVPKKVSDSFIHKREALTGRKVFKESADYFFKSLPQSLKALHTLPVFEEKDKVFLWTHQKSTPVFKGPFGHPLLMKKLLKYQSRHFLRLKPLKQTIKKKALMKSLHD